MNNTLNKDLGWTIINYDNKKFAFKEILEREILQFVSEEFGDKLDRLEDLHHSSKVIEDLEVLRQKMFEIFREDEFQTYYKMFAKFLIDKYKSESALVQKTPTARIQPPKFMTTSFHSDSWYGHSQSTNSFWVPVTDLLPNNTLNMAPSNEISDRTVNKIVSGNFSLNEINDICMEATEPSKVKNGQILTFAPNMIHGAKMNTSDLTRVTFDFRIVDTDNDLAHKPISNYYHYHDLSSTNSEVIHDDSTQIKNKQFLSYSNLCSGVNPKSQLILCNTVSKNKGISIQRNESEIYVFENLPVLRHYLGDLTPEFDGVVVFSVEIFNGSINLGQEILNLAKQNSKQILFAAEDILFTKNSDNQEILKKIQ